MSQLILSSPECPDIDRLKFTCPKEFQSVKMEGAEAYFAPLISEMSQSLLGQANHTLQVVRGKPTVSNPRLGQQCLCIPHHIHLSLLVNSYLFFFFFSCHLTFLQFLVHWCRGQQGVLLLSQQCQGLIFFHCPIYPNTQASQVEPLITTAPVTRQTSPTDSSTSHCALTSTLLYHV